MSKMNELFPGGFDSNAVEPQENRDFSPMPAGLYTVEITNSEVKDLKSGNGVGLSLEYTVIDPEQFARRKVWQNLNIKHNSTEAEQIGQSQLSALCRAVGLPRLTDSDHLFQKILRVRLKVHPPKDGYAANNDVTGYEAMNATAAPAPVTQRQASAPASGKPTPPWQKKAA